MGCHDDCVGLSCGNGRLCCRRVKLGSSESGSDDNDSHLMGAFYGQMCVFTALGATDDQILSLVCLGQDRQ